MRPLSAPVSFCLCALVLLLDSRPASALPTAPVYDDLWDVSRGTVVTDHSPFDGTTDGIAMFGGTYGQWEPTNLLFEDGHAPPYTHFVEWQTPLPVTVGAFNLASTPDDATQADPASSRRSFARFRLYAWDGTGFQPFFDSAPVMPYPNSYEPYGERMPFSVVLGQPVTSSRWRAEFDQQVWTYPDSGIPGGHYSPRITELDGFPAAEPATLSLLLTAGLTLARRSRRPS